MFCFCHGKERSATAFCLTCQRPYSRARAIAAEYCDAIAAVHSLAPTARAPGTPREREGPREDAPFLPPVACGSGRRLDVRAIQWPLLGLGLAAPPAGQPPERPVPRPGGRVGRRATGAVTLVPGLVGTGRRGHAGARPHGRNDPEPQEELELELIQPHMTQKPMLRGEVGACRITQLTSTAKKQQMAL